MLEELFERALPLQPVVRDQVLDNACAGDAALRTEVEAMISATAHERGLRIERFAPEERPDPIVGSVIGRWRVVDLLGRGGMASVYRAERADGEYQQQGALKLVSPGVWSSDTAERFRTERQVLAQLSHPNIARLLDGGLTADGRPYLIMELVDGSPITQWCELRQLPLAARLRLFRVVCEAVQHAHGMLVVHRDLKPANTFVTAAGEVKLLDFGIAKLLEPAAFGLDAAATREQPAPLTPEYAAPEQLFGGVITTASDVFSLGVLLYEVLTGTRPFHLEGKTPVEIERELMSTAIAAPSRRTGMRRGEDVDSIVLTALRAQPERRYVSAGQLGEDIGRYLDGRPILARRDTLAYRARRFVGRNRAAVVAAVAFALSIGAFGIVAAWQARRAAAERDIAQVERDKAEKVVGLLVDLFETSNPNVRPESEQLSIRQFLAQAEPRVLERLADQPAIRARMRQAFGLIHAARDEPVEARAALEQALAEQRRLLGPDHPEAIESLYQLGLLRQQADDEEGGQTVLREALDRCLRVFGENDERTARTLISLASEKRLEEARALLQRAYAIRRRVLPPNHPDLAESVGLLAQHYRLVGDTARARELYTQALATFHAPEDRRNNKVIVLLNDFGILLNEMGESDEGNAKLRDSVELAKQVFGEDSLPVAHGMHNLAVAVLEHGQLADGEQVFRTAYERHRVVLGEAHWETVNVGRDLAWTLALEQRHEEALSWFDRAIADLGRAGSKHVEMLHHMQGRRAVTLLWLGRSAEAIAALTSALAAAKAADPPDPAYIVADLQLETALALLETGRAGDAEALCRAGLAGVSGNERIALANALLGWALVRSGQPDAGRKLLVDALPVYRKWGLADPRAVASLDRTLAESRP